jgi:hypothetical protein
VTTEHVTIDRAPDDSDGERFVRGLLRRPGDDDQVAAPEPDRTPARIPAGVRQEPPRPHPGSAWLRALHHELKTGAPIDPARFD